MRQITVRGDTSAEVKTTRWASLLVSKPGTQRPIARAFIAEAYPWMDDRNASHAVRQGTDYAWHG